MSHTNCLTCNDMGYVTSYAERFGLQMARSSPCRCPIGVAVAAGDWRDRLYPPGPGGKRTQSRRGMEQFQDFRMRNQELADKVLAYLEENPEPKPRPGEYEG